MGIGLPVYLVPGRADLSSILGFSAKNNGSSWINAQQAKSSKFK
jgi:hypothetical protein